MQAFYISEVLNETQSLVASQTTPVPINFPPLTYADSLATNIFLVDGSGNIAADSGATGSTVTFSIGLISSGVALWSTSAWTQIQSPNGWSGSINPTGANLLSLFNGRSQMTLQAQIVISDSQGDTQTFLSMPFTMINSMAPATSNIGGWTSGNYAGGTPNFTPSTPTAATIDTSNNHFWIFFGNAWHDTGLFTQ